MFNLVKTNIFSENVNMDKPRRRFLLLSPNISKATLTYSDTLLIPYVDRIEAQNDNLLQFNQTKQNNFQLLYASSRERNPNNWDKTNGPIDSLPTHVKDNISINNNPNQHCGLGAFFILYSNSEHADSELWDVL